LACRECYYESYLQQKQDIKREQALLEQKLANLDDRKQQDEAAAKQALLDQFERTQTSVLGQRKNIRGGDDDQGKPSNTNMTTALNSQQDGAGKRNHLCLLFFRLYSLHFSSSWSFGLIQ
jgi:nitric oxide synthase-interacting protein